MRTLWLSSNNTGTIVIIVVVVLFLLIFTALFILNLFSAKNRLTFYIDGQDVKKYYYKFNQIIQIPEELNMFTWYLDEDCTIEAKDVKMRFKEINLYTKTSALTEDKAQDVKEEVKKEIKEEVKGTDK